MGLMRSLTWLLDFSKRRRIAEAAAAIAQASQNLVWQRVSARSATMRASEARGYIRARAAQVIWSQVDLYLAHQRALGADSRGELIDLATTETLHMVVRQWVQTRPGVAPAHVATRRAA